MLPFEDGGGGSGGGGTTTTTTTTTKTGGSVLPAGTTSNSGGGTNVGGIAARVAVAGKAVQVPGFPVDKTSQDVYIRPAPGNTNVVQLATYASAAVNGPCDFVGPTDSERKFPVDNLAQIYIAQVAGKFTAGDGIVVSIRDKS